MIINILKRLVTGILLALFLAFITAATIQAQDDPVQETLTTECGDCHAPIQEDWEKSLHGLATVDIKFVQSWEQQNKPPACLACHTTGYDAASQTYEASGITCDACHTVVENGPTHPEQLMTTDYSAVSCGQCHTETYIEWQVSEHGEAEMNCNNCHNPHSTSMKTDNVQSLCQTCHTTESHFYSYTAHADEGLLCTDCHLKVEDTNPTEGHSRREHTFAVDLETCNECHKQEMHTPEDMPAFVGSASDDSSGGNSVVHRAITHEQPVPASYLNFVVLAGLVGLAFGAVGSPWFERGLRLFIVGVR